MSLSTNGQAVLRKMQRRAPAIKRALEQAARTMAPVVNAESKKILQAEVYNVPIPLKASADRSLGGKAALRTKTTKGSKGKWSRTGNLKRLESAVPDGPDVLMRNNAKYAAARSALGGPNPPNRAGRMAGSQRSQAGIPSAQRSQTRSVQWQSEAATNKRTFVLQTRRSAVLQALTNP